MKTDRAALARLVARDPALPGLAVLLDEDRLLEAAATAFPDLVLRSGRRSYTRYKHATNCLCLYEVERADDVRELLTVKTYSADNAHKRDKTARAIAAGCRHAALGEPVLEFTRLPFDPKLPALQTLFDDTTRTALLSDVFPDDPTRHDGRAQLLAYKPERRAVLRFVDSAGVSLSLKIHTERRHEDSSRKLIRLASRGPLHLPGRIASSSGHGIVVAEWLEGELLADALVAPELDCESLRRVGEALAALQEQDPQHLAVLRPRESATAVQAMAEALAILDSGLGRRAAPLAQRLATRLASEPTDAFPVHGDFYAKQVLLAPDAVGFIDLDAAARGSGYEDVGCFLAHLDRDVVRGRFSPERAGAAGEALLEGLVQASHGLGRSGPELHHASALFGLLADPFRRNEKDWLASAHALLDRVSELEAKLSDPLTPLRPGPPNAPGSELPPSPDPGIPTLAAALDPTAAAQAIEDTALPWARVEVLAAEIIRHKPGRRALIDYRLALHPAPTASDAPLRLLGKLRRRRIDYYSFRLAGALQQNGFGREGPGDVVTPEPVGLVLDLQMWLQRFEAGRDVGPMLLEADAPALARRIAAALHRVHSAPLPRIRSQTLADELEILDRQLAGAAETSPELAVEINAAHQAIRTLAARISPGPVTGIHRDFHPHQILARADTLVLLDFDLFSEGEPLIDAGNFAAHIQELALRERGAIDALADVQAAFEERFLALTSSARPRDLARHRALAFLRHVAISQRIEDRQAHTAAILAAAREQIESLR
ncbi:MAG: phosphotransferase [Myxococcota bacterium]|nr:phosphotransferase [Myxococcota bacterium]